MDAIRAAIGEHADRLRRFSYGTFIGALTPTGSRGCPGDGARRRRRSRPLVRRRVDRSGPELRRRLTRFSSTAEPTVCAFAHGGDPAAAYDDSSAQDHGGADPGPSTVSSARSVRASSTSASRARCSPGADGYDTLAARWRRPHRATALGARSSATRTPAAKRAESIRTRRLFLRDGLPRRAPPQCRRVQRLADRPRQSLRTWAPRRSGSALPCTLVAGAGRGQGRPVHAPDAPPILVLGAIHDPRDIALIRGRCRSRRR